MYHLPAYLALSRWVTDRRVVVLQPRQADGPRVLLDAGPAELLVVGPSFDTADEFEARPGGPQLPLRDQSVDIVVAIESFAVLDPPARQLLLREAERVLRPQGLLAVWIEQPDTCAFGGRLGGRSDLDYWRFEEELGAVFTETKMIAQMPWQGFSLAPIADLGREPKLHLREELLPETPEASHFLALASKGEFRQPPPQDCVLVPIADHVVFDRDWEEGVQAREELEDEVERLREELSRRAASNAVAKAQTRDLVAELARARADITHVEGVELQRLREALRETESQLGVARRQAHEQSEALTEAARERDAYRGELETQRQQEVSQEGQLHEVEASREQLQREAEDLKQELEGVKAQFAALEADLQVMTRAVSEHERVLQRRDEELDGHLRSLEAARSELATTGERQAASDSERQELRRQVEVLLAEREGARKLAARVEAELELAQRHLEERSQQLAAKIEEASRSAGELNVLRRSLSDSEQALDQTRNRAEMLSASAAQGAEQGRMLADIAVDRDRLREEVGERGKRIVALEGSLWEQREALAHERVESVRLGAELQRQRELAERSREIEQAKATELEEQGRELRGLELEKEKLLIELRSVQTRNEKLAERLQATQGESEVAQDMRQQLDLRGQELAKLSGEVESERLRAQRAEAQVAENKEQVERVARELSQVQACVDEQARLATGLQAELDIKQMESEELAATVSNLQHQLVGSRAQARDEEQRKADLQESLEVTARENQELRRRLRTRDQELEDLSSERAEYSLEVLKLRRELEATAEAHENLERNEGALEDERWPEAARRKVASLRRELEELQQSSPGESEPERLRMLQREIDIRAAEQERMLAELDRAEQRIWEMSDAADRNAARFAASLAQLERHKERIDELGDELDVTRSLLNAEQARTLEYERQLASERAKSARLGARSAAGRAAAELEVALGREDRSPLVALDTPARRKKDDAVRADTTRPRIRVEVVGEEEWPEDADASGAGDARVRPGGSSN